jgi:hypothetical protein
MDTSTFDPTRAVVFDLNRGQVSCGGISAVMVTAEALTQVCGHLEVSALRQFGAALGRHAGGRIKARLGKEVPSLEVMADQLGGELSLGGLGSLVFERWGQALVVQIERSPLGRSAHDFMSAYVEAAIAAAFGREVHAVVLERGAPAFRLLLCNKAAAARVKGWISSGGSWGDALVALHQTPRNDVGRTDAPRGGV